MNQIITWLAPDPWRSLIRTNISEILFRSNRKIWHVDISPSSSKPMSLSSSANKRRYHFFRTANLVKRLYTVTRHLRSSKNLQLQWLHSSSLQMCSMYLLIWPESQNCHLLWDSMRLYLLPHWRIVWYLLDEGPHSNQLHFYHLVVNTTTTISVELLCTTLLSILETTYSSSK